MPSNVVHLNFVCKTPYEKDAFQVVKKLQRAGYPTFFVGGFARDLLLKRKRTDIDIATQATPEQVKKILTDYKILARDERFGTLRVLAHKGVLELTTFREESLYEKRRRPKEVRFIEKVERDAKRRDFTINALFYDPVLCELFDFVGGVEDVKNKLIRCVGDPKKRFSEDALRMLRAFRFQAQLGFEIEKKSLRALEQSAPLIQEIAKERVRTELEKLLAAPFASMALRAMHRSHLLNYVLPEIFVLSTIPQNPEYHSEGDVFTHTLLALEHLPKNASNVLRFALLFHDVGKATTTKEIEFQGKRKIVSYGHEVVGANMVPRIFGANGLRFDKRSIAKIQWLVRNHMVMYQLPEMRSAKQMAYATHKWFPELLELDRADDLGRIAKRAKLLIPYRHGKKLLAKAQKMTKHQSLEVFLKKIVTGDDVKKILGIQDGPKVGSVLREIRQLFFQGKVTTRKQALRRVSEKVNPKTKDKIQPRP
jgi:poly(A) polymerase